MESEKIWHCKIGGVTPEAIRGGGDLPMRRAVEDAFVRLTGVEATFNFSGWATELTPMERAVVTKDYSKLPPQTEVNSAREMVHEFHERFGHPTNHVLTEMDDATRLLRGNLLLEEVLEYLIDGLGLDLKIEQVANRAPRLRLRIREDVGVNPIECLDGLADINVIIHGNAWVQGLDLDAGTAEVHRSNMSKLGEGQKPLINGVTENYRVGELGYRSELPVGKILKGPDYSPPNLIEIVYGSAKSGDS